ncbi:MAG: hypothetical protein Q8O34_07105 [Rhodocyclaceae bacterium]|nr:hypothetical protein [Rhodocyclaceae bacterium]
MKTLFPVAAVAALFLATLPSTAQVRVQAGGASVNIGAVGSGDTNVNVRARDVTAIATEGNNASVNIGGIGGDVDIQGVTVINGRVYIDGKEIPPKVTRYKSPRTGEVYIIRRKGGSVEVTSETEAKK